ncbi:MAG TPA: FAD-binding oxidoreductase [Thermoprotei archaeon]|nr:FAD-binding oxidoreductase [Thermoprotei archaeon]
MKYEVIVLGGGIAGSSLAYHLCKKGVRSVLIDRSVDPDGATAVSGGMVTRLQDHPDDIKYAIYATRFYREVDSSRESISDGLLSIEDEEYAINDYDRYRGILGDIELYEPTEIIDRWPYLNIHEDELGIYSKNDLTINPRKFLEIIWSRIEDFGCEILRGYTATHIICKEDYAKAVMLSNYDLVHGDLIVSCLGAWNKSFLRSNGVKVKTYLISIPIFKFRVEENLDVGIWDDEVYGYWRPDENHIIGGGYDGYIVKYPHEGFGEPMGYSYDLALDIFKFRFNFRYFKLVGAWTGVASFTYNYKPIANVSKKFKNLYVIDGLGGEGLVRAPALSLNLAKEIVDKWI